MGRAIWHAACTAKSCGVYSNVAAATSTNATLARLMMTDAMMVVAMTAGRSGGRGGGGCGGDWLLVKFRPHG